MSKHTPGPWIAHKRHIAAANGGIGLAVVHVNDDIVDAQTTDANAALIAAAPDLLSAARKALAAWTGDGPPIVLDELRAAIAKAEGR